MDQFIGDGKKRYTIGRLVDKNVITSFVKMNRWRSKNGGIKKFSEQGFIYHVIKKINFFCKIKTKQLVFNSPKSNYRPIEISKFEDLKFFQKCFKKSLIFEKPKKQLAGWEY